MKQFIRSFLSRKFLLTLGGAIALWQQRQFSEFVILLLGYVGVQGASDIVGKYKNGTLSASDVETVVSHNIETEVDTSKVVTGNSTPLFNEEIKE